MNRQQIISACSLSMLAVLFVGCNASLPNNSFNNPVLGAAVSNGTNYVAPSNQQLGFLAGEPSTQTASIRAYDDFAFTSSQTQTVSFSSPENATHQAEATFCTEYKMQPSGNDQVDYNSCVLSAPLLGGNLDEELNGVNQNQNVIGVVSFQDPSIQPIYQEFHFD